MLCPFCNLDDDRVIDSRSADGGGSIRRRRECNGCGKRFTTYERTEKTNRLTVIKRDGTRVPFELDKILQGVRAACGKRPISEEAKESIVATVGDELHRDFDREVPSQEIGRRVAARLRGLDHVAYIRFASEYYDFRTIEDFTNELEELRSRPPDVKGQTGLFPGVSAAI